MGTNMAWSTKTTSEQWIFHWSGIQLLEVGKDPSISLATSPSLPPQRIVKCETYTHRNAKRKVLPTEMKRDKFHRRGGTEHGRNGQRPTRSAYSVLVALHLGSFAVSLKASRLPQCEDSPNRTFVSKLAPWPNVNMIAASAFGDFFSSASMSLLVQ